MRSDWWDQNRNLPLKMIPLPPYTRGLPTVQTLPFTEHRGRSWQDAKGLTPSASSIPPNHHVGRYNSPLENKQAWRGSRVQKAVESQMQAQPCSFLCLCIQMSVEIRFVKAASGGLRIMLQRKFCLGLFSVPLV